MRSLQAFFCSTGRCTSCETGILWQASRWQEDGPYLYQPVRRHFLLTKVRDGVLFLLGTSSVLFPFRFCYFTSVPSPSSFFHLLGTLMTHASCLVNNWFSKHWDYIVLWTPGNQIYPLKQKADILKLGLLLLLLDLCSHVLFFCL